MWAEKSGYAHGLDLEDHCAGAAAMETEDAREAGWRGFGISTGAHCERRNLNVSVAWL